MLSATGIDPVENRVWVATGWHRGRMRLPASCPVLALPGTDGGVDLQVGLARPIVLRALGEQERAFVTSLEGGGLVSPAQARRFARVVSLLTAGGAWEIPQPPRAAAVAVHGAGALGMEIAFVLARDGFDVALHDPAPAEVEPHGTFAADLHGTCAGAAATTLANKGVAVRVGGGGERIGVAVCMGAPDPLVVAEWMRSDIPYVLAVWDGETLWVSHVMVPGLTACARCRDLALTRGDPCWPSVALQLGGAALSTRRAAAPRLSLPMAAARVASRVATWLGTGEPGQAERVDVYGGTVPDPLSPSPDCGCGAAEAASDEVAAHRAVGTLVASHDLEDVGAVRLEL